MACRERILKQSRYMSKIIYYIGAGASYGKNDARELIGKGTDNERLLKFMRDYLLSMK